MCASIFLFFLLVSLFFLFLLVCFFFAFFLNLLFLSSSSFFFVLTLFYCLQISSIVFSCTLCNTPCCPFLLYPFPPPSTSFLCIYILICICILLFRILLLPPPPCLLLLFFSFRFLLLFANIRLRNPCARGDAIPLVLILQLASIADPIDYYILHARLSLSRSLRVLSLYFTFSCSFYFISSIQ